MSIAIGPGETFAGYRIDELIGRGGMGVVYRATDLSLERPVALKLIAPEYAENASFRQRFLKEPKLAAALDHPNVVPIYEAREHDGQLYLAMRYVPGTDLRSRLAEQGPLDADLALRTLVQVADALDAAHRRGLVHRDVKPANILLDDERHAYLTDFGISKQLSSQSTATEQVVGTLDYMAPERIRGERADGSSDQYALACVLYECLTGTPPFRRETEAETLWAHMQGEPPPVPGHPELERVIAKGLAKDPDDRYDTCAALIDAARPPAVPGVRSPRVRRRMLRRRSVILAGGLVLVAGAAAAAVITSSDDPEPRSTIAQIGNGIAALAGSDASVSALIESGTAPSNVAVGEGAVWVLNTERAVVTRIDPATKRVTGTFKPRGFPTDLAAGEGALWIGNGAGRGGNGTSRIDRVDPETHKTTHRLKLPGGEASFNWGFRGIVVGDGAVWALNPDGTISRIDPDTGRRVAIVDIEADALAASGDEVWAGVGQAAVRIDPQTNKPGQEIEIGSPAPSAIAVGGGYVWLTAEQEGLLWRIEPGPDPATRSIDVGVGVTYVAYGAGAVWTANYVDGIVTRVDPAKARVTSRTRIGAAQALAAGAGSAWVSTAGAAAAGTLPDTCGELSSTVPDPDVLVVSDLPLQGPIGSGPRAMEDAIRLVLQQHDHQAGRFSVGYRSCDNSTAQTGGWENRRCAANANAYAAADDLVAMIGPFNSPCAQIEVPILNRARAGPLGIISPSNTHAGLTRPTDAPPGEGWRGEPDVYYPTGERNYARVVGNDNMIAGSLATLARRLGLRGVYVLDDGDFWRWIVADPFRNAAKRLGVRIAGSATYDPQAESHAALLDRVARSGADAVVLAGSPFNGGDKVVKALRARFGKRLTLMGSFDFAFVKDVLEIVGPAAHGMYVGTVDIPRSALPLSATGRQFAEDLGGASNEAWTLEAAQAMEVVLDAIARSDGTRASVLEAMRATKVKGGILGTFGFDENGDITPADMPIIRITGSTPPEAGLPPQFQGSVVHSVIRVPPELVE
jgi:ABC-type branched-subunit amino acid transport system substrate-binding protein/DNA-binding beta-propeller fold protein YncE